MTGRQTYQRIPQLVHSLRPKSCLAYKGFELTVRAASTNMQGSRIPPVLEARFKMYAVIDTGSRQFKVAEGQTLVIDRVPGNAGEKFTFKDVLMIGGSKTVIGAPKVAGATVEATIKEHTRGDKILVFKYKRRKNYKRTQGHRQPQTVLEINKING